MLHYGTQPHLVNDTESWCQRCLRRAVHVRHSKPELWFVRERFLLEKTGQESNRNLSSLEAIVDLNGSRESKKEDR